VRRKISDAEEMLCLPYQILALQLAYDGMQFADEQTQTAFLHLQLAFE
jgi:hypothetical protein